MDGADDGTGTTCTGTTCTGTTCTGTTWKLSRPCTRAEAALIEAADWGSDASAPPPAVATRELVEPDGWLAELYLEEPPRPALLARLARLFGDAGLALAAGAGADGEAAAAAAAGWRVERLPPADWLTLSQEGLEPVTAGRFHVHTARTRDSLRAGRIGIRIEAGQAFGTGQHDTTAGCLEALDRLARRRPAHRRPVRNALDLGAGSGVLAIAVARRWPQARVTATDVDPVAVRVARDNLRANRVRAGRRGGTVALAVAAGMRGPLPGSRAPYDLIVANILAAPLIALAGPVAGALAPGGTLLLSGILAAQRRRVLAAYRARGCLPLARFGSRQWPTLVLRKA